MKKHLGTVIGTAIVGALVFTVWDKLVEQYGLGAGWFAALWIIGLGWFVNHAIGVTYNTEEAVWIDMALGIGVTGIIKGILLGKSFAAAVPTLLWVVFGGALGGLFAFWVEESLGENYELE